MHLSEIAAPVAILVILLIGLFAADHFITRHYQRKKEQ